MIRTTAVATLVLGSLFILCPTLHAQEWARKMFDHTEHNFLGVARGSKVQHVFPITNLYQEDVHIASVRSSCGCTSAEITQDTLKTHEKGAIVATFNTRAFTGQRGATLTVTIDKPYYAEVQLKVSGYIRTDVVLYPVGVDFGSLDVGQPIEKQIKIDYAGRDDWQLTAIKSPSPYITAEATEVKRGGGSVGYDLVVRLAPDAPVGYIKEQLILVTNDRRETQIPVDLEGQVVAAVTVSPASLFLGVLEPGQKVTKQIVVRAKRPFKVLGVDCANESLQFKLSDGAKPVHMIPVTFVAGETPGKITEKICIRTDLGEAIVTECLAYAQVTQPTNRSEQSKPAQQPETQATAQAVGS